MYFFLIVSLLLVLLGIILLIVYCRAAFMTKMMLVGEQAFKFNIWDTAGQERVMYIQKLLICNT